MLHRTHLITLVVVAIVTSLGLFSSVAAQTAPMIAPVTPRGFTVSVPAISNFFVQHGREGTFGAPISNDFQLLGHRVQIFENQILVAESDGSVHALDVLSSSFPLTHAAGSSFPAADPDFVAGIPSTDQPDYVQRAMDLIGGAGLLDADVPDSWNGIPVNFNATFWASANCANLLQPGVCDDEQKVQLALDVWGLPTSSVQQDPNNPDLISLRFQRAIMQYSQSTGVTSAVPIGKWFKQVLIGTGVPDDLGADMASSPFLAQYRPTLPLGLARPADLQATSLTSAFSVSPAGLTIAASPTDATATPIFGSALPSFGSTGSDVSQAVGTPTPTFPSFTGTPTVPNTFDPSSSTPVAGASLTGTPVAGTPGATVTAVVTGTPGVIASSDPEIASGVPVPTGPIGPDPCAGDEQIMFAPAKPYVGTDVLIAVTSVRHHDVRTVRLAGPVKSGPVTERAGLNGWVWEWTISPPIDGWYDFTFFTDGARPCATSGFNALPAFGATAIPSVTATPAPFTTATPTVTATATVEPAPVLAATGAADPASGACGGRLLRLNGTNFGATQATLNGTVLFTGASGTQVATILSWTNSMILVTVPTGLGAVSEQIVVTTSAGATTPLAYQLTGC